MKRIFALLLVLALGFSIVRADDKPTVQAAIALDENTKPTDTFSADAPKLYAFFKSQGSTKGDVFRGVWIADDVGTSAPANTKIIESSLTADQDDYYGAFSVSKPTAGWPVGKYHVDIYVGDDLITTVKFTIEAAAAGQ